MAKIFISYRRDDTRWPAQRIYDAFTRVAPKDRVFMDVDSIPLGTNFAEYLDEQVARADILLALIGPNWLSAADPKTGTPRLHDPDDFVRIEIASALNRGIPVVPVLLDGARMPTRDQLPADIAEITLRNGEFVSLQHFESDAERLIRKLGLSPGISDQQNNADEGNDFSFEIQQESTRDTILSKFTFIHFAFATFFIFSFEDDVRAILLEFRPSGFDESILIDFIRFQLSSFLITLIASVYTAVVIKRMYLVYFAPVVIYILFWIDYFIQIPLDIGSMPLVGSQPLLYHFPFDARAFIILPLSLLIPTLLVVGLLKTSQSRRNTISAKGL